MAVPLFNQHQHVAAAVGAQDTMVEVVVVREIVFIKEVEAGEARSSTPFWLLQLGQQRTRHSRPLWVLAAQAVVSSLIAVGSQVRAKRLHRRCRKADRPLRRLR
jgi:hypothetical protein